MKTHHAVHAARPNSFAIRDVINGIASLLFPASCIVCDMPVPGSRMRVCDQCWNELKLLPEEIIESKPVPEHLESIFPVFEFDDTIQSIIHGLKYSGYKSLGIELGKKIAARLPDDYFQKGSVLIPVPLHPVKKRERGYNQAELIAKGISNLCNIPVATDILIRAKNTETQTHLNAEERQDNMKNAFTIDKRAILAGITSVVLIDDVFTTGATLNSAASVLSSFQVRPIRGLTAAAPIQNH